MGMNVLILIMRGKIVFASVSGKFLTYLVFRAGLYLTVISDIICFDLHLKVGHDHIVARWQGYVHVNTLVQKDRTVSGCKNLCYAF